MKSTDTPDLARTCNAMYDVIERHAKELGIPVEEYFDKVYAYFTEDF